MSRIGKTPIVVPAKAKVRLEGALLTVEGPKGTLTHEVHRAIEARLEGGTLVFSRGSDSPSIRALHGTQAALARNMIKGVLEGFRKSMEIVGVGYRVEQKGRGIQLFVGYSHSINFEPLKGVEIKVESPTKFYVEGADRQAVGQVAAEIREFRSPEPYKGKGIKYVTESIRRKAGKKTG